MTVKYFDESNNSLGGASIQLIGEGLTVNFTENIVLQQYTTFINTTEELGIKVNLLSIIAEKVNYQTKTINPRITIRRINTSISTLSGDPSILIKPSDKFKIQIVLNDLDFGGTIKGATVTYRSEFGQGTLTDINNDGIYESPVLQAPVGSYTIIINAYAGDNYDFERYDIYLSVIQPSENLLWFWVLLIVSGIAILGLISYLYAYQRVLKYPKPVRKVRKYSRTLGNTKNPRIDIKEREKAFNNEYQSELKKTTKLLKGKPVEQVIKPEQITKKPIESPKS